MIKKLLIRNYRRFESLDIDFEKGVNVLVGNNDTGKSTLIEAVTLALTGKVNGRQLSQELSPYLINLDATQKYVAALKVDEQALPPKMIIEVYLDESEATDILMGGNNLLKEKVSSRGQRTRPVRMAGSLEHADPWSPQLATQSDHSG